MINKILRTILYYPMTTGRNIFEILRIIDALQKSDCDNVVTPANWLPGNPVIAKPPKTYKELKNTMKNCDKKYSCLDWYLCFINQENRQNMPEYIDKSNDSKYVYPNKKTSINQNSKRNRIQK